MHLVLTAGTNHIFVRAKLITLTVGSFDMAGINWDLRGGIVHFLRLKEGMSNVRRTSVSQNANTLPMQIDIVPPARRVEQHAFERFDSLQLWKLGNQQHADGGYKSRCASHLRLAGATRRVSQCATHSLAHPTQPCLATYGTGNVGVTSSGGLAPNS
jgi:hypothetical protein